MYKLSGAYKSMILVVEGSTYGSLPSFKGPVVLGLVFILNLVSSGVTMGM